MFDENSNVRRDGIKYSTPNKLRCENRLICRTTESPSPYTSSLSVNDMVITAATDTNVIISGM